MKDGPWKMLNLLVAALPVPPKMLTPYWKQARPRFSQTSDLLDTSAPLGTV